VGDSIAQPLLADEVALPSSVIRTDGGTQLRDGIDPSHVEELREAFALSGTIDPLAVFYDGVDYWLADGFHRLEALRHDHSAIACKVYQGTRRDALLYSAGANRHGLKRDRDYVRRAIEALLRDAEWGKWSDREIARQVGCSHVTVGTARERLALSGQIDQIENRTVSRNGTTYTQAPKPAPVAITPEPIEDDPEPGADARYCKYCYTKHSDWCYTGGNRWECGRCNHGSWREEPEEEGDPDDPAPIPPEPEPRPAPPILDPLNPAVPVSSLPDYDGDEWYTPAYLVEAARVAMGSIDLDPASCETAQAVVQAATFYTKADNGITSPWSGNVWMNPPYSVPQEFTRKAIDEWRAGTIAQAIILVNNCTETEWFHELMQDTACICLLRRRAAFWYPNRRDFGARQGQVVFGIGVDVARFTEAFCSLGIILTEVRHG